MEPLYTMEFDQSLEGYRRYNRALILKNKKRIVLDAILLALCLASGIFFLCVGYVFEGVYFIAITFLIPVLTWLYRKHGIRKYYESNKLFKDLHEVMSFFEDRYEDDTSFSHEICRYADLYDIIETKTDFYLMVGIGRAQFVPKANCSPELIGFLQGLKEKYGKKK